MSAFAETIKEEKSPNSPIRVATSTSAGGAEDSYLKQTHTIDLKLLVSIFSFLHLIFLSKLEFSNFELFFAGYSSVETSK